jgi:hypothetical protein
LVTAEAKSIPLAFQLSVETGLPFVVLRKTYKPYMARRWKPTRSASPPARRSACSWMKKTAPCWPGSGSPWWTT